MRACTLPLLALLAVSVLSGCVAYRPLLAEVEKDGRKQTLTGYADPGEIQQGRIQARNDTYVCEGDIVRTQGSRSAVSCAGQKGIARIRCRGEEPLQATWTAVSCQTGYGSGTNASGTVFKFAYSWSEADAAQQLARVRVDPAGDPPAKPSQAKPAPAALGPAQLAQAKPASLEYGTPINIAQAKKIAASVLAECQKNAWNVAVAVVDTHGYLVYFERMDNTQTASMDIALGKAKAAATYRRSTRAFTAGGATATLPGELASPGGLPILVDGKVSGGLGVSGGTGEQDERCARAGLAPVG